MSVTSILAAYGIIKYGPEAVSVVADSAAYTTCAIATTFAPVIPFLFIAALVHYVKTRRVKHELDL